MKSGAKDVRVVKMINVYKNFEYNIEKARFLLDLVILKKFRDEVFDGVIETWVDDVRIRLRKNSPILENLPLLTGAVDTIIDIFRSTVRPIIDRHIDINTQTFQQQTMVIAVTALESYLRDRYIFEKYKNKGNKEIERQIYEAKTVFQREDVITNRYNELSVKDVLNLTKQKEEIFNIMLIRHIIVHRAGEINAQFCDRMNISKRMWFGKNMQEFLEQNNDLVPNSISLVEDFVRQLDQLFNQKQTIRRINK